MAIIIQSCINHFARFAAESEIQAYFVRKVVKHLCDPV